MVQKLWAKGTGLNKTHDADGRGGNPLPATWLNQQRWEDEGQAAPLELHQAGRNDPSEGVPADDLEECGGVLAAVGKAHREKWGKPLSINHQARVSLCRIQRELNLSNDEMAAHWLKLTESGIEPNRRGDIIDWSDTLLHKEITDAGQ